MCGLSMHGNGFKSLCCIDLSVIITSVKFFVDIFISFTNNLYHRKLQSFHRIQVFKLKAFILPKKIQIDPEQINEISQARETRIKIIQIRQHLHLGHTSLILTE